MESNFLHGLTVILPISTYQVTGITGTNHHTRLFFKKKKLWWYGGIERSSTLIKLFLIKNLIKLILENKWDLSNRLKKKKKKTAFSADAA
jgi:hypothetical protein